MTQNKRDYDAPDDTRLAELAVVQHGVVSRPQLTELGYSRTQIQRCLDRHRWHRIHRGAYAVGHTRLTAQGRWMAAVLACGPGALLSHVDAAALHDLRTIGGGRINVTAPSRHNLPNIRCHYVRALHADDCAEIDAIPVTSLARTYLDLAEVVHTGRLLDALEAGARQNKLDVGTLQGVIARSSGRHGIQPLADALQQVTDDAPWLQSEAERTFRALVRAHGLPEPQFNVYVEGELVDAAWPDHRLVVEVDGWAFHRGKRSFANDRLRDRKLVKAGWRVCRFTAEEVMCRPDAVASEISDLLRRGAPWPPPATPDP